MNPSNEPLARQRPLFSKNMVRTQSDHETLGAYPPMVEWFDLRAYERYRAVQRLGIISSYYSVLSSRRFGGQMSGIWWES